MIGWNTEDVSLVCITCDYWMRWYQLDGITVLIILIFEYCICLVIGGGLIYLVCKSWEAIWDSPVAKLPRKVWEWGKPWSYSGNATGYVGRFLFWFTVVIFLAFVFVPELIVPITVWFFV